MPKFTSNGSIFLLVIAFLAGGLLTRMMSSRPALAQQLAAPNQGNIVWEYAIVMGVNPTAKSAGQASICYFRATGCQPETVEIEKGHPRDALAIAVAKLGQDGWEMMGEGKNLSDNSSWTGSLYFKRPKR